MVPFFGRFWDGLVNLVLPASEEAGARALSRGVRWFLHALLLLAVLALLSWLNSPSALNMPEKLPGYPGWVKHGWLPILFVLFYALCWLGWWLWKLLSTPEQLPEFPDITKAWEEAREALARQGIDLRDLPLFLVLGRPEAGQRALFAAAQKSYRVKEVPSRDDAPLHVWATATALYVTCEGCSPLGLHAAFLAEGHGKGEPGVEEETPTLAPGGLSGAAESEALRKEWAGRRMPPAVRRRLRLLIRQERKATAPVRDPELLREYRARLEHFCRLLARDRLPECPVNGVLLLVPDAATDSDGDATDGGATVQHDLSVARRVLQVNCPVVALVCDLETVEGLEAFAGRFDDKQRKARYGSGFPLVPDLAGSVGAGGDAEAARQQALDGFGRWVLDGNVAATVRLRKFLALEGPGQGRSAAVSANGRLVLFQHGLRGRRRRLGRLLRAGLATPEGEPPFLFGGCYLAATGAETEAQAFVPGVFSRLERDAAAVCWLPGALAEEEAYQRYAGLAWLVLAVLGLAVVGLLLYQLLGPGASPSARPRR
jgi:hypothetical protein